MEQSRTFVTTTEALIRPLFSLFLLIAYRNMNNNAKSETLSTWPAVSFCVRLYSSFILSDFIAPFVNGWFKRYFSDRTVWWISLVGMSMLRSTIVNHRNPNMLNAVGIVTCVQQIENQEMASYRSAVVLIAAFFVYDVICVFASDIMMHAATSLLGSGTGRPMLDFPFLLTFRYEVCRRTYYFNQRTT
jgi:hypothetical protein